MSDQIKKWTVEAIKERYKPHTVVELEYMHENKLPHGIMGLIQYVDYEGLIHVNWENGSNEPLNIDLDKFTIL